MKAIIFRGGVNLIPESRLESDELESWEGKKLNYSVCMHCYPQGPGAFPFESPGKAIITSTIRVQPE